MTPEELGRLFDTFSLSAFRLETLPTYRIDSEAEPLRLWREGHPPPDWRKDRPWLTTVRNAIARGASMQRVRVGHTPLTEYQRFELEWGFPDNASAGEQISILELGKGERVPDLPDHDYWLFDNTTAVRLEYDDEGRFLRPVAVDDVEPYRHGCTTALASAIALRRWKFLRDADQASH